MAGENNPYFIAPANPLQALMTGVQGYDRGAKGLADQEMKAGRIEAMQALQSGGDMRPVLARLLGIGDTKGVEAIATYAKNQSDQEHQKNSLAETSRFHTGSLENQRANTAETARYHSGALGQQAAALIETRRQHDLTAQQPFKLGTDSVGNDVYGVRDLKGGYRILDPSALPGAGGSGGAAPSAVGPAASPAVGGAPAPQSGVTPAAIAPLPFKPTDSEKTTLSKTTTAYSVLDKELERYGELIKDNGVSLLPGTAARTSYDTARRNIQLQMKELYNLGVLNGPDLGLMNQMLVDPTAGVRPDATVSQAMLDTASAPVRALYKGFVLQGQANTNITDLRNSMKNIYEANRDVILRRRPAQPAAAPQATAAPQSNPAVVPWQTYFGTK